MKNKTKILILAICLVVIGLWIYWEISTQIIVKPDIELREDKLITNQTLIDMIVNDLKSPLGNRVTKIILDDKDAYTTDDSWKYAYYVCTYNEHSGWFYFYNGKTGSTGLYGPYDWCFV